MSRISFPKSIRARVIAGVTLALAALIAVLVVRAQRFVSRQISAAPAPPLSIDRDAAVQRLAEAVRIQTISYQDRAKVDRDAFEKQVAHIERSFPAVHRAFVRERVAGHSLLYSWRGSDASLPPVVLTAHYDVVPIADPDAWTAAPFGGEVRDGFVWGRGSLDDKGSMYAILEAIERLIAGEFQPTRTLMLAFGHDEEIGGSGARAIVAVLKERGIRPELVLDEGSIIADGLVPGVTRPVALLGITEKGYATIEITAKVKGGHSSMPPRKTAAGLLAAAVLRLEAHPLPASLDGVVALQLDFIGPEMKFGMKLAMANRWLFGGVIEGIFANKASSDAMLRTTTAVTMLEGSPKENVLPPRATARVNFRIKPGQTVAQVLSHVEQLVAGEDVTVKVLPGSNDPPAVSPIDSPAFGTLQRTIAEVFPDAIFAPSLVIATTDARHYAAVSSNVYRFVPIPFGPDDLGRFHGVDERVGIDDYVGAIRFYARLIQNAAAH
jgi:carboxypeptidase PM20D1